MKVALVSVFVDDPNKAHAYYTGTLGFISRMHMPDQWIAIVASPEEPNGTGILLEPNHNTIAKTYQSALRDAALPCITFGVADLQAEFEKLKARGVVFKSEPRKTDYGHEAVFDDSCGNYIQLVQVDG